MKALTLLLICLCAIPALWAQERAIPVVTTEGVRTVQAVRISNNKIVIDGQMSETEWQLADPAGDFTQQQPKEGALATEPTEIRFLYDDKNLYLGGMLYDDEPDKLVVNELTRDFNARDGDLLVVVFDTFRDKTNGYAFQTNPGGAIRDVQSYDDGRTINQNWDGVWYVQASITEKGWIVEEAIPFKSLRFPKADKQTWGLQVFRLIRRKNEPTLWSPVPRAYNQFKVSFGGILDGMEGVEPGRNIRVTPFFTSSFKNQAAKKNEADGGIDLKMGLGSNLVLDATYRTDFSQVEADAQQVNLTRFNIFFPEKRQFFLENLGTFQMGPPSPSNSPSSAQQAGPPDILPFFSRTIGLADNGEPVPIQGGLRLSGKVGRNIIGLLNIQTDKEQRVGLPALPATNFSVIRLGRQFLSNSQGSVFYLGKERGDTSNRLGGGDIRLNLKQRIDIDGLWMRSAKTGTGNGVAWRTGFNYDWNLMKYTVSYLSLGDRFRDDMGFIPRQGVDIFSASTLRRLRPRATYRFVREYRPQIDYSRYARRGFGVETGTVSPSLSMDFADGSALNFNYRFNDETLTTPFRIRPGYSIPTGQYRFQDSDSNFFTSRARWLSVSGGHRIGEYWNGNRRGGTVGARVRFSPKLATSVNYSRDNVRLPGLAFATDLVVLRVDRSFTNRMFLNAFIQYNSQNRQVISNVRFDFIHHPLSDLYLVYNETRSTNGGLPSRALIVKLTHLLSF